MTPKKTVKKIKRIKAWGVVFWDRRGLNKYFSGEGVRQQARIYPSKKIALEMWPDYTPIKVTITYPYDQERTEA